MIKKRKMKSQLLCLFVSTVMTLPLSAFGAENGSKTNLRAAEALGTQRELQQNKFRIEGDVTDQMNEPLVGAMIRERGTNNATITDMNGHFVLTGVAGENSILEFTYLGCVPQEIKVGSQRTMKVVMAESVQQLEEYVVVGYGKQSKVSIVGSISTLEPAALKINTGRATSNALAGQLAGIIGVQRSGEPGYDGSNFWIRGISTFGGARNPLVLVDGVERNLDNIDPEEIESISVLKDASASAVYGVRGANGVIQITTKRGKEGKPTVGFNIETGIKTPTQMPKFIGSADYLDVLNSARRESGLSDLYSAEYIDKFRRKVDPELYPDVNWIDAITGENATNTRANVTVNGGSSLVRYNLVTSLFNETGMMAVDPKQSWDSKSKFSRYNVRGNVDVNITKSTLLLVSVGGYMTESRRAPQSVDELFNLAFETPPIVHPTIYSSGEIPRVRERNNPWARATQRGFETASQTSIQSLVSLEQDLSMLTKGLKVKAVFSFDSWNDRGVRRQKDPTYVYPATQRDDDGNLITSIENYGQEFLGYEKWAEFGNKSTYLEANANYSNTFNEVHKVDGLLLYNQRHYDDGAAQPYRNQGISGRASYTYANRYIAEANFGYNGSENFARGRRFGFFPSVALGWYISEEPFFENIKKSINQLKLRASYGLAGNDRIDGRRFAYLTTINNGNDYRFGTNNDYGIGGKQEGHYGNPDMTWETVTKKNIGIDLGLFSELSLQLDFFEDIRDNIFMQRKTIPISAGFIEVPWANFGKVRNQGLDMSLEYNRRFSKDLFLSARGTFTYAKNTIIEQDEPLSVIGTLRSTTGKPVGQIMGLLSDGLFSNDDFENVENGLLKADMAKPNYGPVRPGDIKYRDLNGDKIISELDKTAIGGTEDPTTIYGFGLNIKYRQVDFGFFGQGMAGTYRVVGNNTFIPGSGMGALGNYYSNAGDRWTAENQSNDVFYPRLSWGLNQNNLQTSTWWLKDMGFIRIKNVELGYSLPTSMANKIYLKNLRVFARATNLLTFSAFNLWDPELGNGVGTRYPPMMSFTGGLELSF